MHGGVKHPVFYASKKLIPREQNYSVGEREALAIMGGQKVPSLSVWTAFHA